MASRPRPSGWQTASAASSVHPPMNADSRANRRCSASARRSWKGPGPGGEDGQAPLQPGKHLLWSEDLGPGGRQLDGQGQAVEPGGDLRHGRGVLLCDQELGPHRDGPIGE